MADDVTEKRKQALAARFEAERETVVKRYDVQMQSMQRRKDADLQAIDRRSASEITRIDKMYATANDARNKLPRAGIDLDGLFDFAVIAIPLHTSSSPFDTSSCSSDLT